MQREKRSHARRKPFGGERGRHGKPDFVALAEPQLVTGLLDARQRGLNGGPVALRIRRGLHLPDAAHEQRRAQPLFELLDLLPHRAGRDVQFMRRQREAVVAHGGIETDLTVARLAADRFYIVTGTGKYFKNVEKNPETNLGIVRIASDGTTAELLWGYKDGGKFTSEFPAHMMSHMARLAVDPENRVVMHCHPTNTLAMNYVHELDEKKLTHTLWEMCTECIVVFPDGVGVLPWMLCGTNSIGEATAEKMKEFRLVIWGMHGIYGAGKTLDETFGLIETVEKAAQIYMLTAHLPRVNTIRDDQMQELAEYFGVNYRKDFLNL